VVNCRHYGYEDAAAASVSYYFINVESVDTSAGHSDFQVVAFGDVRSFDLIELMRRLICSFICAWQSNCDGMRHRESGLAVTDSCL
jgi:hypothetical protein